MDEAHAPVQIAAPDRARDRQATLAARFGHGLGGRRSFSARNKARYPANRELEAV
jgi:hypothetical protein